MRSAVDTALEILLHSRVAPGTVRRFDYLSARALIPSAVAQRENLCFVQDARLPDQGQVTYS